MEKDEFFAYIVIFVTFAIGTILLGLTIKDGKIGWKALIGFSILVIGFIVGCIIGEFDLHRGIPSSFLMIC